MTEAEGAFQSRYSKAWLATYSPEVLPQPTHDLLDRSLKSIDRQVMETTNVFTSQTHPDVSFAYATASVNDLLNDSLSIDTNSAPKRRKVYKLILPGWNPPNHLEFQGLTQYLMLKDQARTAQQLADGTPTDDITYITVGYPSSHSGGAVTEDWIKGVKSRGFAMHGELFAEFLNSQIQFANMQNNDKIELYGFSTGAAVATETARVLLSQGYAGKHQITFNFRHPAGLIEPELKSAPLGEKISRAIRYPLGFGAAGFVHDKYDQTMKEERTTRTAQIDAIDAVVQRKTTITDSPKLKRLKNAAAIEDYKALVRGTPAISDIRTIAFSGAFDLTQQPNMIKAALEGREALKRAKGNIQLVGYSDNHPFRFRTRNGVRMAEFPIDHYENFNWAKKIEPRLRQTLEAIERIRRKA